MAITVDATVGGANANSFATVADADAHLDTRLNASVWPEASTDDKGRALIESTRELSARAWKGSRVNTTQALSWPRQWAHDPDSPTQGYYTTTVVPARVKRATMELALEFLKAGTSDIAALPATNNIRRKKVDVLETEYAPAYEQARGLSRFPAVMREISPLLAGSRFVVPVLRG